MEINRSFFGVTEKNNFILFYSNVKYQKTMEDKRSITKKLFLLLKKAINLSFGRLNNSNQLESLFSPVQICNHLKEFEMFGTSYPSSGKVFLQKDPIYFF